MSSGGYTVPQGRTMDTAIGSAIQAARELRGLGRGMLAERAGIAKDTLRSIERGKTGASLTMLEKIAHGLGLDLSELLRETNQVTYQEQNPPQVLLPSSPIKLLNKKEKQEA